MRLLRTIALAAALPSSRCSLSQLPIAEQELGVERPQVYSVPIAVSGRSSPYITTLISYRKTQNSILHTINFTIGTPPQQFNASLNLHSNKMFVPSARSISFDYEKRKYRSADSTTYTPHGAPAMADYLGFDYEGILSGDTVQIGGIKTQAQIFEEYTTSYKQGVFGIGEGFDGVLGLAPPWNSEQDEQRYPNYLAMLQSRNTLKEDVLSLKLPRSLAEQGEITFGGSNSELYIGAFRNVSLLPDQLLKPQWKGHWAVPLTSLTLNSTVPFCHPTPNYAAILSSVPILVLPKAFVTSFSATVGTPLSGTFWATIPCERRPFLPEVIFELGGESFAIDGWDYVFENGFGEDGEIMCGIWVDEPGYMKVGEETVVIGTVFLKRWYSRWEFGGNSRKVGCKCSYLRRMGWMLTVMQLRN